MSDPLQRSVIADAPISVILYADALSTEAHAALLAWRHRLESLRRPYEIFLLQETRPEVTAEVREDGKPTRTFFYERAQGFRDVLNEAIRAAQNPLLLFCTCDSQFEPMDLDRMLKVIDQVDLVVGFRVGKPVPFWRLLIDMVVIVLSRVLLGIPLEPTPCWFGSEGWGRRWIARWIFGLRVHDPECPFRLTRREIFRHIPLQSAGAFAQIEMLAKANHLTCLIAEEPVDWIPPTRPPTDAVSFAADARRVFHEPDFGTLMPTPAPAPGTA